MGKRGRRRKTEKMLIGETEVILKWNYSISDITEIVIETSLTSCR